MDIIKVILADDEPLIIKGLRKLINWEAMGLAIVGQAYDGNELLELIESSEPDIVISDISMPHRTGIEIIKELKQRNHPAKVIFISAYQEFSYARDAVTYGAVDYLVKPIVKQQLEDVLQGVLSSITKQQEEMKRKSKLQQLEKKSKHEELQDWLLQLTDGSLTPQSEGYKLLAAELRGPLNSVAILEIDQLADVPDRWSEKEGRLIEFAIGNIVQEIVVAANHGLAFLRNHKFIAVISHADLREAVAMTQDILDKIKLYLKLSVSAGVSGPADGTDKLEHAYREAEQALQLNYFLGRGKVIGYEAQESKQPFDKELYGMQMEVVRGLTSNAWQEALAALNKLLAIIRTGAYGNRTLAVSTCLSSVLFIVQEMTKSGVQLPGGAIDMHELQSRLGSCETFKLMQEEMVRAIEQIYSMVDVDSGNKDKILLSKIKQYIEEKYAEEITLESVAGIAFMNPYYFSSFFKKHTKQNFKQYVTEVRMKQAVRLLLHTDMMVYEIADQVGYNNARHFSDMFKKQFGRLPNDYRQERKKNE
ncbi:response regulator [Paenibacillus harenae]|uniref:response regulator n=1 Tax=Paenibacillus harenae TaxID=306543 RepID=UPI002792B7FD|nr:response regulator [Paenibacillus harenae]MDQ0058587.1 two-component system response regulator YesN [Paenibacillus harenae]